MHAKMARRKEEIERVRLHLGIPRLGAFGSAARGTDFDLETCDADFLVRSCPDDEVDPLGQFFDLVDALSGALVRPVDLIENGAVASNCLLFRDQPLKGTGPRGAMSEFSCIALRRQRMKSGNSSRA